CGQTVCRTILHRSWSTAWAYSQLSWTLSCIFACPLVSLSIPPRSTVVQPGARHSLVLELGLPHDLLCRRVAGVGDGPPVPIAAEQVDPLPGTTADGQPLRGAHLPVRPSVPAPPCQPMPPVEGRVADDGQSADLRRCWSHVRLLAMTARAVIRVAATARLRLRAV